MIRIYTDGAAQGNPGPGGYGTILKFNDHVKELSRGFRLTTNNRMELLAVIAGLEAIRKQGIPVTIYSDSKYVVEAVKQGWLWDWEKKNFKKKANPDLWKRFIPLYAMFKPKFVWIKGHAGHPENERCDELAVQASNSGNLLVDEAYEQNALQ
ncbi:ribonuclease HI [Oscillatoria amoena NRMC-F 0135]|nr:ribonuclease HI [Oscillatoria amoena NRMC-F 0135]